MMGSLLVKTPCGVGSVWGIGPGVVLVELDYSYLVAFRLDEIEHYPV
jgi:hypothetical protein